jgi:hypothetical protein
MISLKKASVFKTQGLLLRKFALALLTLPHEPTNSKRTHHFGIENQTVAPGTQIGV